LAGNYLYYKHATGKIKEVKRSRQSSLELTASLADAGGVHRWVVRVAVVVFILSAIAGAYVGYLEHGEKRRVGKISFYTDYDQGLDEAFETGKPVMLVFSASWCGACKAMIRDVFSNDEVADASGQLVNIYIDVDRGDKELVQEYDVKYIPAVFFLDYSGETTIQVTDRRSPSDFIENIDYMVQVHSYNQ
jgi:thiol:disulfide interchange protein